VNHTAAVMADEENAEVTANLEVEAVEAMTSLVQEFGYTEADLQRLVKDALNA
jgi:hypothetical protein